MLILQYLYSGVGCMLVVCEEKNVQTRSLPDTPSPPPNRERKKADLACLVGRLRIRGEQPPQSKTTSTPWYRSPAFLAPSMGKDKASEDRVMQSVQVVSPDPP